MKNLPCQIRKGEKNEKTIFEKGLGKLFNSFWWYFFADSPFLAQKNVGSKIS